MIYILQTDSCTCNEGYLAIIVYKSKTCRQLVPI